MGLRKDCQLCWDWDDCHFDKSNSREHHAEHGQFKRDLKLYRALPWRIVPNVAPLRWMIVPNVVLLCWTIVPMSFRGVEWLFSMSLMLDDHRIEWIVLSLPLYRVKGCTRLWKITPIVARLWGAMQGLAKLCDPVSSSIILTLILPPELRWDCMGVYGLH